MNYILCVGGMMIMVQINQVLSQSPFTGGRRSNRASALRSQIANDLNSLTEDQLSSAITDRLNYQANTKLFAGQALQPNDLISLSELNLQEVADILANIPRRGTGGHGPRHTISGQTGRQTPDNGNTNFRSVTDPVSTRSNVRIGESVSHGSAENQNQRPGSRSTGNRGATRRNGRIGESTGRGSGTNGNQRPGKDKFDVKGVLNRVSGTALGRNSRIGKFVNNLFGGFAGTGDASGKDNSENRGTIRPVKKPVPVTVTEGTKKSASWGGDDGWGDFDDIDWD